MNIQIFIHRSLSRFTVLMVYSVMMNTLALSAALSILLFTPLMGQILPPITVGINTNPAPGAIYIAPNSRVQSPPFAPSLMVVGADGKPLNSRFIPEYGFDFRILADGRMGYSVFQSAGSGARESSSIFIVDTSLQLVDTLFGANEYNIAMHSFDILPNGNRLMIMQENVTVDMSALVPGGNPAASVQQMLIQELDVDGNILFQWRSLDHFPVTVSYEDLTAPSIRYFHLNSIVVDTDGHFLISARHASTVAKIHRKTGKVLWILGGKLNQFTFSKDPSIPDEPLFSYQHDVNRIGNGNITMFDNGSQRTPQWSRVAEYQIDEANKTCKLVWQYRKTPDVYAGVQGAVQTLPNGNKLISWGSALQNNRTIITEVDLNNKEVYEIELPSMMYPYKAMKAPYPTGRHAADVLIDEILPTNTYTYTRGKDTVGLTITYHTLISFFYNTTTARRYMWAPENPTFEQVVNGKPQRTLPPYLIYPCRVTLTQEGMVDHAGEFRFSARALGITDPAKTIVYYRDSIGQRSFRPLRTRYNPNTRELVVDTARTGEFCFGSAVLSGADSISAPKLLSPIAGKSLLEGRSFRLKVSPQGQTQYISYQIQQPIGSLLIESTDKQTDKEIAPGFNPGTYFWRARSRYGTTTSEWTDIDTFRVEGAFLAIRKPASKAVWYHDSAYAVTWNTNIDVPVKLELIKNGTVAALIKDNIPGQHSGFLWKVPVSVPIDTGYAIRITPMDVTLESVIVETPFTIEVRGVPSSVRDNHDQPDITIGPNPVAHTLYVGGYTPISRIQVFGTDGLMYIDKPIMGSGDVVDVSSLPIGTYMVVCETPRGVHTSNLSVVR